MKHKKTLCALLVLPLLAGCQSRAPEKEEMQNISISSEYGSKLQIDPSLIDDKGKKLNADLSSVSIEEGKDYPAIGTYTIPFTLDGKQAGTITLTVADTTPPEFTVFPVSLEQEAGSAPDLSSLFQASDLSGVTLSCSLDETAWNTPGTYTASIKAADGAGNVKEQSLIITITEPATAANTEQPAVPDPSNPVSSNEEQPAIQQTGTANFVKDGILVVNKKHPISSDYAYSEDPAALAAARSLIADAQAAGLDIGNALSGFRSEGYQASLYNGYVASAGQAEADTYSARPGYSEHQSGLAFDFHHYDGSLVERAAEAAWLQANCARYGFILRYPAGKESITGYIHEPWHLRYIGERAAEIMNSGLTLEEFLGVEGGDYPG